MSLKPGKEALQLKTFRKSIKLSQKNLAAELKRPQSIISKYETGDLVIPYDVIKHMHLKYGMNYEWYFHSVPPMRLKPQESKITLVKDIAAMSSNIKFLEEKTKQLEKDLRYLASIVEK